VASPRIQTTVPPVVIKRLDELLATIPGYVAVPSDRVGAALRVVAATEVAADTVARRLLVAPRADPRDRLALEAVGEHPQN
jgi:hypothetical protein